MTENYAAPAVLLELDPTTTHADSFALTRGRHAAAPQNHSFNTAGSSATARGAAAPQAQPSMSPPEQRTKLWPMAEEDGSVRQWYFSSDDLYIDVAKDENGKFSIFIKDRTARKEGWLDQADAAGQAAQPSTMRWIATKDAKPNDDEVVFIAGYEHDDPTKPRMYQVAYYCQGVWSDDLTSDELYIPTHWMRPANPDVSITDYGDMQAAQPVSADTASPEDKKYAERYRWLREHWFMFGTVAHSITTTLGMNLHRVNKAGDVETLDAAIDAAIAAQTGEPK